MDSSDYSELLDILNSFKTFQGIATAATLNIADQVGEEPISSSEIASKLELDPEFTERLLLFLCQHGIFQQKNGKFLHTNKSRYLLSSHPNSLAPRAKFFGADWHWNPWGKLAQAIKTGNSGFKEFYQMDIFKYLEQNPLAEETFRKAMPNQLEGPIQEVVSLYDFSNIKSMIDIGGGGGGFLEGVLNSVPHLKGTLFDLPEVIDEANKKLPANERLTFASGSFFDSVPAGHDLYFISQVLHDWDDESVGTILKKISGAMNSKGRLIIREILLCKGQDPHRFLDMEMLVMTSGGKERTLQEFNKLLDSAGLMFKEVYEGKNVCLLEAVKP